MVILTNIRNDEKMNMSFDEFKKFIVNSTRGMVENGTLVRI